MPSLPQRDHTHVECQPHIQKHAWVQKLWTGFCHAFEFPTWPLGGVSLSLPLFSWQIKATVVCTRVIKGSLSLTDPALHTSAAFHGLDVGAFSLSSFNGRGVLAEKESLLPQAPSTAP